MGTFPDENITSENRRKFVKTTSRFLLKFLFYMGKMSMMHDRYLSFSIAITYTDCRWLAAALKVAPNSRPGSETVTSEPEINREEDYRHVGG